MAIKGNAAAGSTIQHLSNGGSSTIDTCRPPVMPCTRIGLGGGEIEEGRGALKSYSSNGEHLRKMFKKPSSM